MFLFVVVVAGIVVVGVVVDVNMNHLIGAFYWISVDDLKNIIDGLARKTRGKEEAYTMDPL